MNVQRNSHQLKHNDHAIGLFALFGPLQIRIPNYAHAQIFVMTNHWVRLYNLGLWDVFKMMITMLFYLDLSGKNFRQQILRSKNFFQKLHHQVAKAVRVYVSGSDSKIAASTFLVIWVIWWGVEAPWLRHWIRSSNSAPDKQDHSIGMRYYDSSLRLKSILNMSV